MTEPASDILTGVRAALPAPLPDRLGVAVSGGSDSVALLQVLARLLGPDGIQIRVVTVDHGLRAGSATEARQVADLAADLGLSHDILRWEEGPGPGNLQDQARTARYALMADWARAHDIPMLALGHTADDQAETVLMRLSRAAGVNGLSGMAVLRQHGDLTLWRPLLGLRRADLRQYLRAQGLGWADDPSNEDRRFERVRLRSALPALEDMGLSVTHLATIAQNMQQARQALDHYAQRAARDLAELCAGAIALEADGFADLPDETAYRLLMAAVNWVGGARYPARRGAMLAALSDLRSGRGTTLAGTRLLCRRGRIWICREAQAVRQEIAAPDGVWDRRWKFYADKSGDCQVRALGAEGLHLCPDWRDTGLPGPVLEVTPALWRGGDLIAAPIAGQANGCRAELLAGTEEFHTSFLSH